MKRGDTSLRKEFYPIPAVINPGSYVCVSVPVPNHPDHLRAFRGALATLEKWWNWERTGDNQGSQSATVWRDALLDLNFEAHCDVIQYRTDDCSLIEFSVDGGETWELVADLSDCTQFRMDSCGVLEYSTTGGESWQPLADLNTCYIMRDPISDVQNIILPTIDDYVPLQLKPKSGGAADSLQLYDNANVRVWRMNNAGRMVWQGKAFALQTIANTELGTIYPGTNQGGEVGNGTMIFQPRNGFGFVWATALSAGAPVRKMHLSNAGKLAIGENVALANIEAMLNLFPKLATDIGDIIRAAAAQTANLREHRNNSNVFLSGVDNIGRYINATAAGKPSDTIVKAGTVSVDAAAKKVWIKGANSGVDDWFALEEQPDPCCIENVEITMIDAGDPPSGSVDGDTLTLQIPYTEVPTPANYWFKFREDRPAPGETKTFELVCLADGFTMLPCEIDEYDVIVMGNLTGWWGDETFDPTGSGSRPVGYSGHGLRFDTLSTYSVGTDPRPDLPHMCTLLEWQRGDGSYATEQLGAVGFSLNDVNSVSPYARIFPNKSVFDGSPGGIQFSLSITAAVAPIIICGFAGFVSSTHGFILKPSSELPEFAITGFDPEDVQGGVWVLGEGFESTEEIQTDNPTQTSQIVAIKGTFDTPLTGSHRYTFTFELSGVVGADINIRGQRAHKPTGLSWVLGNMSHAVFYGNGTHDVVFDGDDSEAVGLLLHTIPTATANDWKITIKSFDCEAL